jgi:tetrapyrrole methylase family protein / MazG family protein
MQNTNHAFSKLIEIVKELRGKKGCPWDKKQTVTSLTKYLREEFDELLQAISNNDLDNMCEEAGDMMFLLVMLAEINAENKAFEIVDVIERINMKLIRRHPHVFAGVRIDDEDALRRQWLAIKAEEKSKRN